MIKLEESSFSIIQVWRVPSSLSKKNHIREDNSNTKPKPKDNTPKIPEQISVSLL